MSTLPLKQGSYQVLDNSSDLTSVFGDVRSDPNKWNPYNSNGRGPDFNPYGNGNKGPDWNPNDSTNNKNNQIGNPNKSSSANQWFNVDNNEEGTNDLENYFNEGGDLVFYLVQANTIQRTNTTPTVVWKFISAPGSISWGKTANFSEEDSWATAEKTLTYGGTSMKKLSLGEILIEGLSTRMDISPTVANLEKLLNPVQYKNHIAPLVYELICKTKNDLTKTARSYGYYVITDLSIEEQMRDKRGRPLRVKANLGLLEVPKYQINTGRDLSLPDNLVVKIDKTAEDELKDKKDEKPDGSTDKDKNNSVKSSGKYEKEKINGKTIDVITYEGEATTKDGVSFKYTEKRDRQGRVVNRTYSDFSGANANTINKYTQKNELLEPYINPASPKPNATTPKT